MDEKTRRIYGATVAFLLVFLSATIYEQAITSEEITDMLGWSDRGYWNITDGEKNIYIPITPEPLYIIGDDGIETGIKIYDYFLDHYQISSTLPGHIEVLHDEDGLQWFNYDCDYFHAIWRNRDTTFFTLIDIEIKNSTLKLDNQKVWYTIENGNHFKSFPATVHDEYMTHPQFMTEDPYLYLIYNPRHLDMRNMGYSDVIMIAIITIALCTIGRASVTAYIMLKGKVKTWKKK